MTELHKKVASAIATGALLINAVLPVLADVDIEISGNGNATDNDAEVMVGQSTSVTQTNTAIIHNKVDAYAETGDNDANKNTGGDVTIDTGDADVEVDVTNEVNKNAAEVGCCDAGDVDVLISGNGNKSDNEVKLGLRSQTSVWQDNMAMMNNQVSAGADTGGNDAEKNTGGDVTVETGDATVDVAIENEANVNSAVIGDGGGGMTLSARIVGNGNRSDNDIRLHLGRAVNVTQWNGAFLHNRVDANAETGDNDADKNTGGDVVIDTGDADVGVSIDNMANFNFADVDCGCLMDVSAKIAKNGNKSDNDIKAKLFDRLLVFQDNLWASDGGGCGKPDKPPCGGGDDYVGAYADTGDNDANKNTGDPDGDPSVFTGDADIDVELENSGNVNVYGAVPEWELPDWLGGFSLNISLDLSALLTWLGLA